MNMNNRKSPIKQQQRSKNSNRMRSNSSMGSGYIKNSNSYNHHYSQTSSPTAISSGSSPAVPLFYTNTYADPPDCSSLPQPPESWYLKSNDENLPKKITHMEEKPKPKVQHKNYNNNRGFYSPFYSTTPQTRYISVKA